MSKGLVSQMRDVRLAVLGLTLIVVVLGVMVLAGPVNEAEREPVFETVVSEPSESAWLTEPTEPITDTALASLSSYANREATRIAKMAELMLGLGGEYTAKCEAVYNSVTDKVETEYSIRWLRDTIDHKAQEIRVISETWTGDNWAECIHKMMIWRGGK